MDDTVRQYLEAQYDACSWVLALTKRANAPDASQPYSDGGHPYMVKMVRRNIEEEMLRAQNVSLFYPKGA